MSFFGKRNQYVERRRSRSGQPVLMVRARVSQRDQARMQQAGTVVIVAACIAVGAWLLWQGCTAGFANLFSRNSRFTITAIDVASSGRLSPGFLRGQAGVAEGQNLFAVDVNALRTTLEAIPQVQSASVRRRLPGKLEIAVTERLPLARISLSSAPGIFFTVDREGVILPPGGRTGHLPVLSGLGTERLDPGDRIKHPQALNALALLDVCDKSLLGQVIPIRAIDAADPSQLLIVLANGGRVHMGCDQFERRLSRLADMLRHGEETGQELEDADLTVNRNEPVRYRARVESRG